MWEYGGGEQILIGEGNEEMCFLWDRARQNRTFCEGM